MPNSSPARLSLRPLAVLAALLPSATRLALAQQDSSGTITSVSAGSVVAKPTTSATRAKRHEQPGDPNYWKRFALGVAGSLAVHESGHIIAAYLVGGHPTFGLDAGRPTVYSGISAVTRPRQQFVFSSAGLTLQSVLDEVILDRPSRSGSAIERGVLAGGIATVVFYGTIGRSASVSDVTYMARTSSLSKGQVSLIYGAIAAVHALRVSHDSRYANFFAAPAAHGGLALGLKLEN